MLLAEVTGVDVASRTIEASSPGISKIAYDYLLVATGMRPSFLGHDEFAQPLLTAVGQRQRWIGWDRD